MDSLTHLAVGAVTPFAFNKAPRGAAMVLFGILCAEWPDIDIVAGVSAKSILITHRGLTHSLLGLLIFPVVAALVFWLFTLKKHRRRQIAYVEDGKARLAESGAGCGLSLWLVAFTAAASHLYLDSMTTFGTQLLMPFSHWRIGLPAMFIVDLLFTIPLVAVMIRLLIGLRDPERVPKQLKLSRRALLWVLLYPLFCLGVGQGYAYYLNQRQAAGPDTRVAISTEPFSPFIWKAVAQSEDEMRLALVSPLQPTSSPVFGPAFRRADPALWRAMREADPILAAYTRFASFPVVSTEERPGGLECTIKDLRYEVLVADLLNWHQPSRFVMQLRLDGDGRRIEAWRFLRKEGEDLGEPWVELPVPQPMRD